MKKLLLLLAVLFSIGCEKEMIQDCERCEMYFVRVYSNERNAKLKCIQEPNQYPFQDLILDTVMMLDYSPKDVNYRYTKWCGYLVTETTYFKK